MALELPDLHRTVKIVEKEGTPSYGFHVWWMQFKNAILKQETNQNAVIADLADVVADLTTVTATQAGLITDLQAVVDEQAVIVADLADLTADMFIALSTMSSINDIRVAADYQGTPNSGQFPMNVTSTRMTGTTDDTLNTVWGYTVNSGAVTISGITNGVLTITDVDATSSITVTSAFGGVTLSRTFTVYLDLAPPPITSGTSASDYTLDSISSATHAAVSTELTVTVGSAGTVTLSAANLEVSTGAVAPAATYPAITDLAVYGKWQWWNGASWADVAVEVVSSPHCKITFYASYGYYTTKGSLTVNTQKTGLTPAASEKFRFVARNSSGTRVMTLAGTASAVGD